MPVLAAIGKHGGLDCDDARISKQLFRHGLELSSRILPSFRHADCFPFLRNRLFFDGRKQEELRFRAGDRRPLDS
jgi:hypothetical protein